MGSSLPTGVRWFGSEVLSRLNVVRCGLVRCGEVWLGLALNGTGSHIILNHLNLVR